MMLPDELAPPLWGDLRQRLDYHVDQEPMDSHVAPQGFSEARAQAIGVQTVLREGLEYWGMRTLCRGRRGLYLRLVSAIYPPEYLRIPARQMTGESRNRCLRSELFARLRPQGLNRNITCKSDIEADREQKHKG
jgi:hypothetical protein